MRAGGVAYAWLLDEQWRILTVPLRYSPSSDSGRGVFGVWSEHVFGCWMKQGIGSGVVRLGMRNGEA